MIGDIRWQNVGMTWNLTKLKMTLILQLLANFSDDELDSIDEIEFVNAMLTLKLQTKI